MVSFQCDGCADTVKKPKLDSHRQRCHAPFTCLDCSTTFHNQEYKGHTSCISEAEKYQGALYKANKKGKAPETQAAHVNAPVPTPASAPTPVPAAAESSASATTSIPIHPSRLQAIESAVPSYETNQNSSYGFSRGGRGGRGGFGARGGAAGGGRASAARGPLSTGENRLTPGNGMRSWGSTPVNGSPAPEVEIQTRAFPAYSNGVVDDGEKKKKKKKKGDKGGTGSKANSSAKKPNGDAPSTSVPVPTPAPTTSTTVITTPVEEPSQKKRKRDPSPSAPTTTTTTTTTPSQPSEKTLKRLRKNISKLDTPTSSLGLGEWLDKVGKGKKDKEGSINRDEVLASLKVGQVDGKWVLEVPA